MIITHAGISCYVNIYKKKNGHTISSFLTCLVNEGAGKKKKRNNKRFDCIMSSSLLQTDSLIWATCVTVDISKMLKT